MKEHSLIFFTKWDALGSCCKILRDTALAPIEIYLSLIHY